MLFVIHVLQSSLNISSSYSNVTPDLIAAFESFIQSCQQAIYVQQDSVCDFWVAHCFDLTQARNRIQLTVRQLGDALSELLFTISNVEQNPHDVDQSKHLTVKVGSFRDALSSTSSAVHSGLRGTQACTNGIVAVVRTQSEFDAMTSFALAKAFGSDTKNLSVPHCTLFISSHPCQV